MLPNLNLKSTAFAAGGTLSADTSRKYLGVRGVTSGTIAIGGGDAISIVDTEYLEFQVAPNSAVVLGGSTVVVTDVL